MNDRLSELGELPDWAKDEEAQQSDSDDNKAYRPLVDKDAKKASSKTDSSSYDIAASIMNTFFGDVELVKSNISHLVNATKQIEDLNDKLLSTTSEEQEKELGFQLRVIIDQANKYAKNTKNILALLKEDNTKLKQEKKINASDLRVRENLCNTLTRKYIDEMKGYQNAQQKYKTDLKQKAKRQIEIFKPDVTAVEIDEILKNGGREEYVKAKILTGGAVSDDIKNAYQHVSGKYKDILTLETNIAELHQMFLDFAFLTEQQGELLDQISFNVKNAVDYTEEGNVEVHQAIEYAKEARKKQMIIAAIVVFVLGLIIIILIK